MNRINPNKLLHSKWTAVTPIDKAKHFMVTEVSFGENGAVTRCVLEAILSKRASEIDWQELKDTENWQQGWK